jgi:hypothetical protein
MSADFSDDDDQDDQPSVNQIIMSLDEDEGANAAFSHTSALPEEPHQPPQELSSVLPADIPELIPLPISAVTSGDLGIDGILPPMSMFDAAAFHDPSWAVQDPSSLVGGHHVIGDGVDVVVPPEFPAAVTLSAGDGEEPNLYFGDVALPGDVGLDTAADGAVEHVSFPTSSPEVLLFVRDNDDGPDHFKTYSYYILFNE